MNFNTYLMCFVTGLLGIFLHIFAVKIPMVKQQAKSANMAFSYITYFQDELAAILASLISVVICLALLNEIVAFKPEVVPYLKFGFLFVGYTGASLVISVLGKAQEKINCVVDVKTNIADGIDPPPPPPPTV